MANEYDYQNSTDSNMWREYEGVFSANGAFNVGKTTVKVYGALRFEGVGIAQGTTVTDALLHVYIEDRGSGSGDVKIQYWGIDEDNTSAFTSNPLGRDKTTATHSPDVSVTTPGNFQDLTVTSEVNEILARAGWSSGNALGFIFNPRDGTPDNRYMYDSNDAEATNSYLTILTATRPDFYPVEATATSPDNPAKRYSYGIRIAKDGFDARIATDEQLSFSSSWKVLKAQFYGLTDVPAGEIKQIPHNLGYKGSFLVFGREDLGGGSYGNVQKLPCIFYSSTKDENFGNAYLDNTNLNITADVFIQGATSMPMRTYYYIFIDEIDF